MPEKISPDEARAIIEGQRQTIEAMLDVLTSLGFDPADFMLAGDPS